MPTELVPVRVEDWLALGRMFDRAAARGYKASFEFCKEMERNGVRFSTSAEALARYRRWSDGQKFKEMMDDKAEYGDLDHCLNMRVNQYTGEVRVREVELREVTEDTWQAEKRI